MGSSESAETQSLPHPGSAEQQQAIQGLGYASARHGDSGAGTDGPETGPIDPTGLVTCAAIPVWCWWSLQGWTIVGSSESSVPATASSWSGLPGQMLSQQQCRQVLWLPRRHLNDPPEPAEVSALQSSAVAPAICQGAQLLSEANSPSHARSNREGLAHTH